MLIVRVILKMKQEQILFHCLNMSVGKIRYFKTLVAIFLGFTITFLILSINLVGDERWFCVFIVIIFVIGMAIFTSKAESEKEVANKINKKLKQLIKVEKNERKK